MKCRTIAIAALLLLGSASLQAEEFTHKITGLKFTLPKGWKCTEAKDGRILIQNADKSIHVIGGPILEKDAKNVFDNVGKFLETLKLGDAKITDGPKKEKVNDLEQAWYEGTARVKNDDGKDLKIEWDLTLVKGGKNILFLIGMGQLDKNEKVYEKFFESIKKVDDKE